MSEKILLECLCDRCGKSIIISEDLQKIIDEIPKHNKVCIGDTIEKTPQKRPKFPRATKILSRVKK